MACVMNERVGKGGEKEKENEREREKERKNEKKKKQKDVRSRRGWTFDLTSAIIHWFAIVCSFLP